VRRVVVVVALAALVFPGAAWGHAVLLRTSPVASKILSQAPTEVRLTYSEPTEPRFAIVSVTDAAGHLVTRGSPVRAPDEANTVSVPLQPLPQGWYLVYWRVISADGHPVRGAFTFAVGPSAGPAPQFVIPSISETAATPRLVITRWIVFLSVVAATGM